MKKKRKKKIKKYMKGLFNPHHVLRVAMKSHINFIFDLCEQNVVLAAKVLKVDRKTLLKRIRKGK